MPVRFLTEADRVRLSCFPSELSHDDLIRFFTLDEADLRATRKLRGDTNRLGFTLQLCALRFLGFSPDDLLEPPKDVLAYLAKQLDVPAAAFKSYGSRIQTRTEHFLLAQTHLGFRKASPLDLMSLEAWLLERALEHDRPSLLFAFAAEKLLRDKIVRPGVTRLERVVASVRQQAQSVIFTRLAPLLTDERRAWLNEILEPSPELGGRTPLAWLQKEPSSNRAPQITAALAKVRFLQAAGVQHWDLGAVNPNRLKSLAQIGNDAKNQYLKRTPAERRYPILLAFLRQALWNHTDDAVEMFDQHLWDAHGDAEEELEAFHLKAMRSINEKLKVFRRLGRIILNPTITDAEVRQASFEIITPDRLSEHLDEAEHLIRPDKDEVVDFFGRKYGSLRRFTKAFMATLEFRSHRSQDPLLEAVALLRHLDAVGQRNIPSDAPKSFIPAAWLDYAWQGSRLIRRYYELATLWVLRGELRAGNVFVGHSRRYADPESYLIPRAEWSSRRSEVVQLTGTPMRAETRLQEREAELEELITQLEDLLVEGRAKVWQEDGKLKHTPLTGEERSEHVDRLEDEIVARLPRIDLADVIIEVDGWVSYASHLEHAAGAPGRSLELQTHLYASLLAHACNFGLVQMARVSDLSYHKLAWCTDWYLREETLKAATNAIVNFQYHQPLARLWGGGSLSSSDGQRFPVAKDAKLARALPKYFGYRKGVTFYTWTSDQFSQYGAKVVPSTIRDATCVLDEILGNETELSINEHTTDTSGYTELIFALFDLLDLRFSPRIKDLGEQVLYRTDALDLSHYPRMRANLPGRIDKERVIAYWDDMLRLAGSLKLGYVTSSLFISKLQAYPRQNELTKALQEYGRLSKTIHCLRWHLDEGLRKRVSRQLNKGEAIHALRSYVTIANKGILRRKESEQLQYQVGCLNLVSNAIIAWNTVYMWEAVQQLRAEGYPISDEDLRYIWPSRYEHINVYGRYEFNLDEARQHQGLRELRKPDNLPPYR